jgi:hypothetical protein
MAVTAVDKEYLDLHFSEFVSETEGRIDSLNETAALIISENVFGDMTRFARMLYIAHLLKLSEMAGRGNVTSEKVGDLARSFGTPTGTSALSVTTYGTELHRIMRIKRAGCLFV